jgi:phage tail sheath gpL-like
MALIGIPNTSPIPRRARQFNPAAGSSLSAGGLRPVILIGNKLSGGTEVVETLGGPIQSLSDCFARTGQRSELAWQYRAYTDVDQNALIYFVAMAEGVSATASTQTFAFANNATVQTVINVDSCKGRLQVEVSIGDTPTTQVANLVAAINADPDLPFSAAVDGMSALQADITTYNKGPRSAGWIKQLRVSFDDPTNATTITTGSVVPGTVVDSCANAIVAASAGEFTYHSLACTSTSSVSSSDGGVGQYLTYIASSVAPVGNKSQMAIFAVDGTSAQAVAVTQSAAVNEVFAHCYRVYTCDWPPSMVAAHHTAVHRSTEVNYAATNLAGWTNSSTLGQVYQIPPPFNKANWPTTTQMTTDLNGGVSTVGFRSDGTPYIVRSITTYSWTGSSSTSDSRAREGHIPSVMLQFWGDLDAQMIAQNQPNVAQDPAPGTKPTAGFMYPKTILSIARALISSMCGAYQNGMALLDPSVLPQMLTETGASLTPGGWEVDPAIACVRHNLFDDTLISEIGPAY